MFDVASVVVAVKGLFRSTTPMQQPPVSKTSPPYCTCLPVMQYVNTTATTTSPLSLLVAIAPEAIYAGLQFILLLALVCSLFPLAPIVQQLVISIRLARDRQIQSLTADIHTKSCRMSELQAQLQREQRQKQEQMAAKDDEMTNLRKQLRDAREVIAIKRLTESSLKGSVFDGEKQPRPAFKLRMAQRHTDKVNKIRHEHTAAIAELNTIHQKALDEAVAQSRARVLGDVERQLDDSNKILAEHKMNKEKIHALEQALNKQKAQSEKATRDWTEKITKLCERHTTEMNDMQEKLRKSDEKNHAFTQELHLSENAVVALERRVKELAGIIPTLNSTLNNERAAASAREKSLLATIAGDREIYEEHVDAANERNKKAIEIYCTELEAKDSEIEKLEVEVGKLRQTCSDKIARIANLRGRNAALRMEVSPLTIKFKHERFSAKRYRKEFSRCLDRLDEREHKYIVLQSLFQKLTNENEKLIDDNIELFSALRSQNEAATALEMHFKDILQEVGDQRVGIANNEWEIRNLAKMEEDMEGLRKYFKGEGPEPALREPDDGDELPASSE